MLKQIRSGFGTIRNNTALKLTLSIADCILCFGTIRNNTALKPLKDNHDRISSFGTIRNNTALKQMLQEPFHD